jgi:hypothetical protein
MVPARALANPYDRPRDRPTWRYRAINQKDIGTPFAHSTNDACLLY